MHASKYAAQTLRVLPVAACSLQVPARVIVLQPAQSECSHMTETGAEAQMTRSRMVEDDDETLAWHVLTCARGLLHRSVI